MQYKICILAAGTGSRIGRFTKVFSKALLPINGKPAICYIIEKFPEESEIIIAVGYKSETIIQYLNCNYINRKFKFVNVDKWIGEGSGPGYSLLCCKEYLQSPFIQFAADTLVSEDIPIPSKNWIGLAPVMNTKRFCSVKLKNSKVTDFEDKTENNNKFAYIGLFGVNDFEIFWDGLTGNIDNLIAGEAQVSSGLQALIDKQFYAKYFKWFDIGTVDAYMHASKNYPNGLPYKGL